MSYAMPDREWLNSALEGGEITQEQYDAWISPPPAGDTRRWFLAGYLSALPEFASRHPQTMLPLADQILLVLHELEEDDG